MNVVGENTNKAWRTPTIKSNDIENGIDTSKCIEHNNAVTDYIRS